METVFHIENKDSFRVLGYSIETTNRRGEGKKCISQHWQDIHKKHRDERLLALSQDESFGLLGISIYNTNIADARVFTYMIGAANEHESAKELTELYIPALTWAIFPCTKETMGKTQVQAIMKWLPKSGYKPLNKGYMTGKMKTKAVDIEFYGPDDKAEIWIAVQEK